MKWIAMILPTTAALLCLAAASRVGDALAQPQRLTFKVEQANARYTQQHTIDVGDVPGHQVRVFEVRRTYPSNPPVINGVKIVQSWTRGISDYTNNNGPAVVYHVYVGENGDKFFVTSSAISPGTTAFVDIRRRPSGGERIAGRTRVLVFTLARRPQHGGWHHLRLWEMRDILSMYAKHGRREARFS